MGVISEADLLNLLRSALSSDTPSTVKQARELMGTGIDPMKLTSQLAKVITDILSGGCGSIASKFGKRMQWSCFLAKTIYSSIRNCLPCFSCS